MRFGDIFLSRFRRNIRFRILLRGRFNRRKKPDVAQLRSIHVLMAGAISIVYIFSEFFHILSLSIPLNQNRGGRRGAAYRLARI
jgi:hypothetical protein